MNKFDKDPGEIYYLVENTRINKYILIGTHPLKPMTYYLASLEDPERVICENGSSTTRFWSQDYTEAKKAMLDQAAKRWEEIKIIYHD